VELITKIENSLKIGSCPIIRLFFTANFWTKIEQGIRLKREISSWRPRLTCLVSG